jgi:type II secretory pathway pseudopilin PulG
MVRNILLPLISLISGVVSLFIDPKKDRLKAAIVVLVLLASAVASGYYGYQDDQAAQLQASELAYLVRVAQSQGTLARNEGDTETPKLPLSASPSTGVQPGVKSEFPMAFAGSPAERPTIQYFTKTADGNAVVNALQSGGFGFVKVPGQRTAATNCIWIGDAVSDADAKAVALALIRAGVQLRSIRRFRNGSGPNANLIEIGSDPALKNTPALTAAASQSLSIVVPGSAGGREENH